MTAPETRDRCFFFGCWNQAGHYLFAPGGADTPRGLEYFGYHGQRIHLDSSLAPRRHTLTGDLCWNGQGDWTRGRRRNGC